LEDVIREQQITLSDYVRVLYRGRWVILISFLVVLVSTVYFTFTTQPVYEASALVMLKEESRVQQQLFEVTSFMKRETMINNQVEILKSDTLANDVIRRLQKSTYADSLWILGNKPDEGAFSLFRSLASWLQDDDQGEEGPTIDDLIEDFRNTISVAPKRDTDMIELKAQAHSPFEASFVANVWMEAYRDLDIRESNREVGEVRKFLEGKVEDVEVELSKSEEQLKEFKEDQKVTALTAETEQLIKQAAEFETLYQEAKTGLEANEKRLAYLHTQLGESKKAMLTTSLSSPMIEELEKQMAILIGEKAAYEQQLKGAGFLSANDSKLKDKEQRIKGIQEKIVEEKTRMIANGATSLNPLASSTHLVTSILEIETENKSLKAKSDALWKIVQQYNDELNRLPEKSLDLARLAREAQVNNNIFMMLREKYEENRIAEAGQIGSVRIIDRAKPPRYPIKPKKKMNLLLGIIVGLGLGVGVTFVREYLDTSLKTIEDVELENFAVLGSIPFIHSQKDHHQPDQNGDVRQIEARLVTHFAPKSPISEAYRTLRTNIQYAKADQPVRTVLVTSSGPGEGKSTSVANLAITFAQVGSKTLLVDTDLRRPVLHAIFDFPKTEGLTNVLLGKTSLQNAVHQTRTENLSLLTSGTLPPNPSELLASKKMEEFVQHVGSQYDIVLFDTPPVIAVTDAAVLSTKLDGTLLVVKSGETGRDALLRSRILLENVKSTILGVLVNGVNVDQMYGSYYYYYHYYYYGDGKHKKRRKRSIREIVEKI